MVVEALRREARHPIADTHGVVLAGCHSLAVAREGLLRAGLDLPALLQPLKGDELQTVCRALGWDDGGRSRVRLVERIPQAQAEA